MADGDKGTTCELMKEPIVMWDGTCASCDLTFGCKGLLSDLTETGVLRVALRACMCVSKT